jgi:fatty-acyl-CoA synthase
MSAIADTGVTTTALTGTPYIDLMMERLADAGSEPVLRHQRHDVTAEDFRASIHRYARALAGLGIDRGDLVALFATNSPDAIAIRYAAHLVGAAAVYLSVPPEPRRRADLVAQMDPQLLVVFPETANLLVPALLPTGVTVPLAAVGGDLAAARIRLDDLAAAQSDAPLESRARPEDLAVIISSGGTTGVPKGSCRSFASYGAMVINPSPADRRQLVNGKLAYLSQALVDTTLLGGGTVVLHDSFDAADTLATIASERITDLFLVEPQLFELMDHAGVDSTDLSSLRAVVHIGASAPPTLRRRARERLGPVVAHTYGASEIGIVSALSPAEHDPARPERFTCAGRIHPGVEVRFRRADGSLAATDEAGSIEVRSPAMASGYRHRPVEQAAAFRDGWYRTGDLGRLDAEGYLHILGRAVDISWVDGVLISPTVVQDALCRVPGVRYAVVVMDPETGMRVAAVVPWAGGAVDADACQAAVAAELGQAVAAELVVVPLARAPRTEQGKPDRPAIRALGREAGVSLQARLREMFTRMVEAKDATLVDTYYDPAFELITNGQTQDLPAFRAGHDRVYGTDIAYSVTYDDDAWVEQEDRLGGRVWITTQRPDEDATRIEVVLLAVYREGRILRLTELTWPDWTRVAALDTYSGQVTS